MYLNLEGVTVIDCPKLRAKENKLTRKFLTENGTTPIDGTTFLLAMFSSKVRNDKQFQVSPPERRQRAEFPNTCGRRNAQLYHYPHYVTA